MGIRADRSFQVSLIEKIRPKMKPQVMIWRHADALTAAIYGRRRLNSGPRFCLPLPLCLRLLTLLTLTLLVPFSMDIVCRAFTQKVPLPTILWYMTKGDHNGEETVALALARQFAETHGGNGLNELVN